MYEPRHPGDAKDLPLFISRAPTEAAVVAIRDVIVVPTTIVQGDYPSEDEQPAGDPAVEIADSLTLEHLSTRDSELVMNACTQRGHYFLGVRQFGARYAFVRQVDPTVYEGERAFGWDDGNVIWFAIVLSRLIRDNAHSFEFAARIVDHEDGISRPSLLTHCTTASPTACAATATGSQRARQASSASSSPTTGR
jgi:hypothetical protein